MFLRTTQQHATTVNPVQTPWNFVEEFGIAGNPNKGHSVSSQLDQTEPLYCRRIPSILAGLSHGLHSSSCARVALGRELQLPMSFSWPIFPGLDQDLFPHMVFLVFWDSIPKRCKGESLVSANHATTLNLVQPPWNFVARVWHRRKSEQRIFGLQSTQPNGTLILPSSPKSTRRLVTRLLL